MKFTEQDYIQINIFEGDKDANIKYRKIKIVTVRKIHKCVMCNKDIKPKEQARFEKAIVDDMWGSYYCCLNCLDDFLTDN